MSRWWRAYDEAIDDAKLCLLSDPAHRAWFNLCCLTSASGGTLPDMKVIALKLRMPPAKVAKVIAEIKKSGLIDEDETGMRPHNWRGRQFKSDVSNERVKRFRERQCNVTETPPETEEQKQKEEDAASAAPSNGYAFESGVVRLTSKDFAKWKDAFSHIDLAAELIALAPWAADQPKWFHAVSGALAKRNREMKLRSDVAKNGTGLPLTPSGNAWPEGIV